MNRPVLVLDEDADAIAAALRGGRAEPLEVVAVNDPTQAAGRAADAKIVLGAPDLVASALPSLHEARWVQSTWAGVQPLLPALEQWPELVVTGVKGIFGPLMAEYVLGYLLAIERRMADYAAQQRRGQWRPLPQGRLAGRRMTLLGLGDIGCSIAQAASGFGMSIRGITRSGRSGCTHAAEVGTPRDLTAFAEATDVLVSILPDTPEARGLIDADVLAALPDDAIFINVGRGSTVVMDALLRALEAEQLKAAVLDVFESEPLPGDHPLWLQPRAYVTPHVAAVTLPEDIVGLFLANLERWERGEMPRYRVDPERGY